MRELTEEDIERLMFHGPPTEEEKELQRKSHIMRMLPGTFTPSRGDIEHRERILRSKLEKGKKNKGE